MKTQQDILHGRSLEEVAEAARAYEESHAPFDKRPMKQRARPPRSMMAKPDIALYLEKISVSFDGFKALNDLTFYVDKGELRCVIGPNGAGKTTLLSAAMGLLPSKGAITLAGERIARRSVEAMVSRGVGLVPEKRELFGEMTVEDNLLLGGFSRWRRGQRDQTLRMQEVFEIFPRLKERRLQMSSTLSGGERQMLAIGRALMARPRLLMLDEPSLGLAPLIVREVLSTVSALRSTGVSVWKVNGRPHSRASWQADTRPPRTGPKFLRCTSAQYQIWLAKIDGIMLISAICSY